MREYQSYTSTIENKYFPIEKWKRKRVMDAKFWITNLQDGKGMNILNVRYS